MLKNHIAIVLAHDEFSDGQIQPGAFAFCRVKRREYFGYILEVNNCSIVEYFHEHCFRMSSQRRRALHAREGFPKHVKLPLRFQAGGKIVDEGLSHRPIQIVHLDSALYPPLLLPFSSWIRAARSYSR